MDIEYYVIAYFSILSWFLRAALIVINRRWFNQGLVGDSSVHFEIVKQLKTNPKAERIEKYVIPNVMSYPILFHRYCSLFPLAVLKKHGYLPNLLIYATFSTFIFWYFNYIETILWGRVDNLALFLSAILYLTSVSNSIFYGPAIAYMKLSSRLLGRFSAGLYYLGICLYTIHGDNISLIISIFFGAVALSASTFAAQVLFFSSLLLSIFYLNISPVLGLFASIVLSLIMTKLYSWRSLKHMFLYWNIYNRYVKKSEVQKQALSQWVNLKQIEESFSSQNYRTIFKEFLNREPSRAIAIYPELIYSIVLMVVFRSELKLEYYYPIVVILIIYLLTTTKYFHHLGESYRYIEYSLCFYFPILLTNMAIPHIDSTFVKVSLLAYFVYVCSIVSFLTIKFGFPFKNDDISDFLQRLNLTSKDVVFPVSMRLGADICCRSECQSFWWQPGGITDPNQYEEYIESYPFLKKEWKEIAKKHGVTHIIVDKNYESQCDWRYDFNLEEKIAESDRLVAYKATSLS